MWPRAAWAALYEPLIRRAAGLGRAPTEPDPDRYAQRYRALRRARRRRGAGRDRRGASRRRSAARASSSATSRRSPAARSSTDRPPASTARRRDAWLAWSLSRTRRRIRACSCCRARRPSATSRTTTSGSSSGSRIISRTSGAGAVRERLWQLRAREVVLATGAIEQPLVFPGNDRPGIMLASAAHTYLHRYGVRAGTRAAVVTVTDGAYRTALDLRAAGVEIAAIVDQRPDSAMADAARQAGIEVICGATVAGTRGKLRVAGDRARGPHARLRPRPDVGRLGAVRAPLFPVARAAHLERRCARFRAVGIGRTRALGRGLPRRLRPCRSACGRRGGGRRGRDGQRPRGQGAALCGRRRRASRTWQRPRAPRRARTRARRPSWISRTT